MDSFIVVLDLSYKDHKGKYLWRDTFSKLWLNTISKRISEYGYVLGSKVKEWFYRFNENKLYVELYCNDRSEIPFSITGGEVYR